MPAIFFALITYLTWSIGDVIGTTAARKIGGYSNTLWLLIIRALVGAIYIPFGIGLLKNLTPEVLILNIFLGIILVTSIVTFTQGLSIGNASLVGTISSSFPAITVLLSLLFLNESISFPQFIAILIILVGILLSSLGINKIRTEQILKNKGVMLGLSTMILWGIYFAFIKIPVHEIGWFWPNYISYALFPLLYLYMKVRKIKINPLNHKNAMIFVIVTTLITSIGDFTYNYGISKSQASIIAPIAGAYPTLFAPLAALVYKDPITKQQIVGIITTLIGIVSLSFLSA